ncbi:hypothetical protein ACFQX7_01035 [Luedemannella flava]
MRSPFTTSRHRRLARRATVAVASVATLAAALAMNVSPASAVDRGHAGAFHHGAKSKIERSDDQLPAPQRPSAPVPWSGSSRRRSPRRRRRRPVSPRAMARPARTVVAGR